MSINVTSWLLTDESGEELRMPITDLDRIMAKVTGLEDVSSLNRIATGGVIKREHLTHDIMTIIGIFDENHIPTYTEYEKGARYFNSTDGKLYLRWTSGWIQPTTPDIERMFVSLADGKLYRYYNGSMLEVGGSSDSSSADGGITAEDI